jgi:hypothetical protein
MSIYMDQIYQLFNKFKIKSLLIYETRGRITWNSVYIVVSVIDNDSQLFLTEPGLILVNLYEKSYLKKK